MKKLATLMIAFCFVCAASVATAADAKYPYANPQDQPHAAASVPKHGARASKVHRHERRKFV